MPYPRLVPKLRARDAGRWRHVQDIRQVSQTRLRPREPVAGRRERVVMEGDRIEGSDENHPHNRLEWRSPLDFARANAETAKVPGDAGAGSDTDGRRYIDLLGMNVCISVGHSHPRVCRTGGCTLPTRCNQASAAPDNTTGVSRRTASSRISL